MNQPTLMTDQAVANIVAGIHLEGGSGDRAALLLRRAAREQADPASRPAERDSTVLQGGGGRLMADVFWSRTLDALGHPVWHRTERAWRPGELLELPAVAACLRRSSWRWAAWATRRAMIYADVPVAAGVAATRDRAILDALAHVQGDQAGEGPAGDVGRYLRRVAVERRMAHPGPGTASQPRELLFDFHEAAHVVVRKTARFVYVSKEAATWIDGRATTVPGDREWWQNDVPTHRIDRDDLERDGCSRGFYTESGLAAARARRSGLAGASPACLATLGVSWPCTDADIRRRYRTLVKVAHPDGGGTAESFISVRAAYHEALAFVQREVV